MALGVCGKTDSSDMAGEPLMNRVDTHDALRICILVVTRVYNRRSQDKEIRQTWDR